MILLCAMACWESILHGNAGVSQEVGFDEYFSRFLALVQNHFDLHAPPMGVHQRLGDRRRSERIGLNEYSRFGCVDLIDHRLGASAVRREIDLDWRQCLRPRRS